MVTVDLFQLGLEAAARACDEASSKHATRCIEAQRRGSTHDARRELFQSQAADRLAAVIRSIPAPEEPQCASIADVIAWLDEPENDGKPAELVYTAEIREKLAALIEAPPAEQERT